jgi:hypothetical protein
VARRWRKDFKKEAPKGTFGCRRKESPADHRRTIRRVNVEDLKTDILRLGFASEGTTFRVRVARRNRIPRKNWDNIPGGNARGYVPGRHNGGNHVI